MTLDLEAIKAREQAAAAGPWHHESDWGEYVWLGPVNDARRLDVVGTPRDYRTAEFIAHAREDVPALVAEVERLRALYEAVHAYFDTHCDLNANCDPCHNHEDAEDGVWVAYKRLHDPADTRQEQPECPSCGGSEDPLTGACEPCDQEADRAGMPYEQPY